MGDGRPRKLAALGLVAVAVAIAASGLTGEFVWDDHSLIQSQASAPAALGRSFTAPFFWDLDPAIAPYYRPLVSLAFALQWRVFGNSSLGYHLVSLLLHLACALLAFVFLERRLAGQAGRHSESPATARWIVSASSLGALLFVAHTSRPQVVSWISGSTDLWSGVFALSAMVLLQRRHDLRAAGLAAACVGLAVMAKETAIAVPIALAFDAALEPATRREKGLWRAFGLALGAGLLALFVRSRVVHTPLSAIWAHGLGSLVQRVLLTLGWEVQAVFAPTNPRMQINYPAQSIAHPDAATTTLICIGVAALCAWAALFAASFKGPRLKPYVADLGLFLVLLAPSLNIVPIGNGITCSERFLYLPLLGVVAACARLILALGERVRPAAFALGLLAVVALAWMSARETSYLASDLSLQEHFYRQDPTELLTIDKLMQLYARNGQVGRARWMNERRLDLLEHLAPPTETEAGRTALIVRYALNEADLVSDDQPARLRELRDFLDAVASQGGTVRLRVGKQVREVNASPALWERIARSGEGVFVVERARIFLHARTLDLQEAELAARALAASAKPSNAAQARSLLAQIVAWQGRFEEAAALVSADASLARAPLAAALRGAVETLRAARALGPKSAIAAEAVQVAELGLPARGRALLASLRTQGPLKPALVDAMVRVELAAKQVPAAVRIVRAAIAADPTNAPQYRAWLAALGAS